MRPFLYTPGWMEKRSIMTLLCTDRFCMVGLESGERVSFLTDGRNFCSVKFIGFSKSSKKNFETCMFEEIAERREDRKTKRSFASKIKKGFSALYF